MSILDDSRYSFIMEKNPIHFRYVDGFVITEVLQNPVKILATDGSMIFRRSRREPENNIVLTKGAVLKKHLSILFVLLCCAVLVACSDDPADPGDGEDDPGSPYSGSFLIESELVGNNCLFPTPPSAITSVVVDGDSIWFAGFPGEWDANTLTGTGDTPEYTVPVDPPDCYAYYKVIYQITYINADSFSGTYGSDFRKDPECLNPDPCAFRYNITGSR